MRFVVDVNLSHIWVEALKSSSFSAVHWSQVGNLDANDETIMQWAGANGYIVVTTDLDFGSILAASGEAKPSVVQFRPGQVQALAKHTLVWTDERTHSTMLLCCRMMLNTLN
jgi:predicted nuclease of predicted toxin-antitoxin system